MHDAFARRDRKGEPEDQGVQHQQHHFHLPALAAPDAAGRRARRGDMQRVA